MFSRRQRSLPSALIVVDDDAIRGILRAQLEAEEFGEIWEAPDGETAIAHVYQHHPRLVILDFMMPGMDGEAVAWGIRTLSPETRVVAFSGVLADKPSWADAFLIKPDIMPLPQILHDTDEHRDAGTVIHLEPRAPTASERSGSDGTSLKGSR